MSWFDVRENEAYSGEPDDEWEQNVSRLSPNDRREVRNFQRFLRVWPRFKERMLKSPRWRKYLGLAGTCD